MSEPGKAERRDALGMKRLFIAIKIHPDKGFIDSYRRLKADLSHDKLKWVEDHNIHVTLKFFGETEEARIQEIIRIMEETGPDCLPFRFRLKGTGIFGSRYDPRVIWVGIDPFRETEKLMRMLRENLKTIGFEPDRQNLVPHLTLGRIRFIRDKNLFQEIIERHRDICSEEIPANSMILFESILNKEGPVYLPLKTVPFGRS